MALFKILRGNAASLPKEEKDGYAYFCTDTHDFYIDYTDNNGQLTRGQLNANAADKLSVGRNISLGTAVSSTATTFDGSKNITIPVTSINEAYLEWGGKNRQSYSKLSPIDYILSTRMSGNKLAFLPEDCIKFESSIDGGITWTEFTSDAKKNMFSVGGLAVRIGNADDTGYKDRTNYRVRITINAWGDRGKGTESKVYTTLYKFLIHCSTNGSTGSWATIETRSREKYLAGDNTWSPTSCTQQTINGWSGTNTINVSQITFGGGPTQTFHTGEIRFTFGVTSHPASSQYSGLIVDFIEGYGGDAWAYPSTMSKTGHLYSYDNEQNATFPKKVTAATLASSGNATVAGTLSVTGASTLTGAVTSGALTASSLKSNGALTVSGNSTLSGTLTVKGNTVLGDATTDTVAIKGPITAENNLTVKGSVTLGDDYSVDRIALNGYTLMSGDIEVLNNSYFYIGQKNDEDWFYVDNSTTSPYVEVYGMPLAINGAGGISIDTGDLFVGGTSYLGYVQMDGQLDILNDAEIYLYDANRAILAKIGSNFQSTGGFQVEDIDEGITCSILNKTQLLIRKVENGTATNMIQAKNDGTLKAATSVTSPNFIGDLTGVADEAISLTWAYFDIDGTIS